MVETGHARSRKTKTRRLESRRCRPEACSPFRSNGIIWIRISRAGRMEDSGSEATQELFSLLYNDLRRLAHARLQRNEPITLLDTTSLVHETFLRILKSGRIEVSERPRFL